MAYGAGWLEIGDSWCVSGAVGRCRKIRYLREMALKKKLYNQYKKSIRLLLWRVPNPDLYGGKQVFPPKIMLDMLPEYVAAEDFEACAAIKDSIREWFEEHGQPIPEDALLKIKDMG